MGAGRNSASKEADRRKSFGAAASAVSPIEGSSGVEPDEGSGHNKGPRLSGTALVKRQNYYKYFLKIFFRL